MLAILEAVGIAEPSLISNMLVPQHETQHVNHLIPLFCDRTSQQAAACQAALESCTAASAPMEQKRWLQRSRQAASNPNGRNVFMGMTCQRLDRAQTFGRQVVQALCAAAWRRWRWLRGSCGTQAAARCINATLIRTCSNRTVHASPERWQEGERQ